MSGGCDGGKPQVREVLKGVRMQRYNVGRVPWWEDTSVGGLKGVNDAKVQIWEGVMVGCHKCQRLKLS